MTDPIWDAVLSEAEFAEREAASLKALDRSTAEEMRDHIRWFCERYPTPLARLKYVRRQLASIAATQEKIARAR